uniref:SET domain-containing protein n=1 Tax=Knipowitschia caucasica TaxID=637954 RepID=A0AAV2J8W8_KNICA
MNEAIDFASKGLDKTPQLEEKWISSFKGRGVFSTVILQLGDFVVEYRGDLITAKEAENRRNCPNACVDFLFDFRWRGGKWCIDATQDDGTFGRLVNDDHYNPNCKMKLIVLKDKPHLFLFALREINQGEEITYDYGGSDCPWRKEGVGEIFGYGVFRVLGVWECGGGGRVEEVMGGVGLGGG